AGYPQINVHENHSFTISTQAEKETFKIEDLFADYGKKNDDYFLLSVQKATPEAFVVNFSFSSTREDMYHVCMTQDLSTIEVVRGKDEALEEWIGSGVADAFSDVLFQKDIGDHYSLLTFADSLYNHATKEIIHVDADDRLSNNGEYVYIDGNRKQ